MKRIIKKIGGDRIGSGKKMSVTAAGYGYSTHDVGKVRRTSMSFGTLVPMGQWLLTSNSRLRMNLDALITSNALLYQLYGSAKFQIDVFSARLALYNPKMLLNLNDQGYNINDIKFPQMSLKTKGFENTQNISNKQVNPSALLRYLGVAGNGQAVTGPANDVTRQHYAGWLLMYYQIVKEYYANKQEKKGVMIHNVEESYAIDTIQLAGSVVTPVDIPYTPATASLTLNNLSFIIVTYSAGDTPVDAIRILLNNGQKYSLGQIWNSVIDDGSMILTENIKPEFEGKNIINYNFTTPGDITKPKLIDWELKAVDRMMMAIMKNVDGVNPILITGATELPYGASFVEAGSYKSINTTQEGLCLGTYQSDVFNNWLDNETINNLNNKSKVKVDANGEFTIDLLNITQKLYNYDQRIGITDGTLEEWRELTYGEVSRSKSLKPVYEGGLSKEIVFDMVISTASTDEDPLGSIASRGNFGNKHKGGYVQIDTDEEKMVMVIAKITPRLVYNQGNDWTTNLKTLDDLHKPALDKIGYQNLLTDQMAAFDTQVGNTGALFTKSAGKQPAWQWYRTNYDDALGNMAETEDYKVFGRTYEAVVDGTHYKIKDLTTYIDPTKFNDVFAIESLDAMNFDVQVGMDATLTLVMSEEVIPNL